MATDLYLAAAYIVVGGILVLLGRRLFLRAARRFNKWAKLIRTYWIFVFVFVIVLICAYILAFLLVSRQDLELVIGLINQNAALIFAIFVGYFAFLQVTAARKDKLAEQADLYFQRGSYVRALKLFEQAINIDPGDARCVSNALELYVIIGDFTSWKERMELAIKASVDPHEKMAIFYLKTMKAIADENVKSSKKHIKNTIVFVKSNPGILPIIWDFAEIKKAAFAASLTGDMKKMFNNYILYLQNRLEKSEDFEKGDYIL